ncbi:hypothetical protein [Pedobacter nutrimenti]|uniref:hypothetical protein n=1 Tax=Pedobacter nutrimenti TaxID=1241337 RepID=UPI00292E677A|nr:hypothetical protein [Pedobacter nutrimenti]
MLDKFFKGKEVSVPHFQSLESSLLKDKYFVRTKPWDWLKEEEIYVVSKLDGRPTRIIMDFWPHEIYLFADGQITVSELIHIAARRFIIGREPVPEDLDAALLDSLEGLVNELKIVELKDIQTDLPLNIELPISRQ